MWKNSSVLQFYVIIRKIYQRHVFENQAKLGFLKNQTKSLKNTRNGVLFLFKTHGNLVRPAPFDKRSCGDVNFAPDFALP